MHVVPGLQYLPTYLPTYLCRQSPPPGSSQGRPLPALSRSLPPLSFLLFSSPSLSLRLSVRLSIRLSFLPPFLLLPVFSFSRSFPFPFFGLSGSGSAPRDT